MSAENFKALWLLITTALLKNVVGVQGTLAKWVLDYGGQYVYDALSKWIKDHERQKVQDVKKEEYEKKKADPSSKPEDIANAYADYINSGR